MRRGFLLSKGISTVVTLLSAFGSVALNIQPPGDGIQKLLSFIVCFGSLTVLLIISAIADTFVSTLILRKTWIATGILSLIIFLTTGFIYYDKVVKYVVEYPKGSSARYIVGDLLGPDGRKIQNYLERSHKSITTYNLIQNGGGAANIVGIWTEASVNTVTTTLMYQYVFQMILLSLSIFSITEGYFMKKGSRPKNGRSRNRLSTSDSNH